MYAFHMYIHLEMQVYVRFDSVLHFKYHLYGFLRMWLSIDTRDTQHTLYICVCARMCAPLKQFARFSLLLRYHRIRFGRLFHLLYRTFVHASHMYVWMNASWQFIHDILRVNLMNFVLRVFVLFFPFTIFYLILLSIQRESFVFTAWIWVQCDPCAPTRATGNAHVHTHRKEREKALER